MKKAILYLLLLLLAGPPLLIAVLRFVPPPLTSFMLQSEVRPVRYQWVPAERIPDTARKAVVAAEDQKFWTHNGFDLEAMAEAYLENKKNGQRRGASSISQQTAKNLFLWPGGGYVRKGIEAYFTGLIELLWSKQRILEVYLNIIEFGPGVYGVEAASRQFFRKSAAQLTPGEAALLAAVLPNPREWSVANPGAYVLTRSNWVLRQMGYRPAVVAGEEEELAEEQAEAAEEAQEAAEEARERAEEAAEEAREQAEEAAAEQEPILDEPPPEPQPETAPAEPAPAPEPMPGNGEGEQVPEAPTQPSPSSDSVL